MFVRPLQQVFLLGAFWVTLGAAAQECGLRITGRVIDDHDRSPLSFANVLVVELGRGAVADDDGRYALEKLCPGTYTLRVSHLGCEPVERRIMVARDVKADFRLEHHHEELRELEVVRDRPDENVGQARTTVDREALERSAGRSFVEALEEQPGVVLLRSGPTVAKPMVHGHSGNRVLILQQGMRQEDQQWGNDHAPSLDPFSGEGITVVKGAASVQYGSDAIGGVVIAEPAPTPRSPGLGGALRMLGLYNGRGGGAGGELLGGSSRLPGLGWRVQGSARRTGDLAAPDYRLSNTGLREAAGSATVGLYRPWGSARVHYSVFGRELGIMRTAHAGNLTDLIEAVERGRPWFEAPFTYAIDAPRQEALHHLLRTELQARVGERNTVELAYGYQADTRREFDIRRGGRSAIPALDLFLATHTGSAVLKHWLGPHLHGKVGVDGGYQANYNIPGTGVRPLIPNYARTNLAVFVLEHVPVGENLEFEAGARLEATHLLVGRFNAQNEYVTPERDFLNHALSMGGNWTVNEGLRLRANISTAFRPPHVSELYSEGLHHGSAAIELGDDQLRGERSLKAVVDAEASLWRERLKLWTTIYHDRVDGYIYLRPEGYQLTIRGAFPVFRYTPTRAVLNGLDAMTELRVTTALRWRARFAMLRARDEDLGEPLFLMPGDRLGNDLVLDLPVSRALPKASLSLGSTWVARQTRFPQDLDFSDPPPAYHLLHAGLASTWPLGRNTLRLGIEAFNLLNVRYRDYLDRFRYFADAPGMDLVLNLRYSFGSRVERSQDPR
jgi:iron complex outermembrane receptor protein